MKKLIIVAAAVMMAVASQAAQYKWRSVQGGIYEAGSSTALLTSGTAYLFNNNTVSQQALLTALLAGTDISEAGSIASGTLNTQGKIALSSEFTYNGQAAESVWNGYLAILNGDDVFISSLTADIVTPVDQSATTISILNPTASKNAVAAFTETFSGSGWYTTTAVPEPTSGLLLLLGMAGLALRRKHA